MNAHTVAVCVSVCVYCAPYGCHRSVCPHRANHSNHNASADSGIQTDMSVNSHLYELILEFHVQAPPTLCTCVSEYTLKHTAHWPRAHTRCKIKIENENVFTVWITDIRSLKCYQSHDFYNMCVVCTRVHAVSFSLCVCLSVALQLDQFSFDVHVCSSERTVYCIIFILFS